MIQRRQSSRSPFESLDERLRACPSWVRQTFDRLDRVCRQMAPDAQVRDAAGGKGRMYYSGPKQRLFCRIDPKREWIGVRFAASVRNLVTARRLSPEREMKEWIYVKEDTDMAPVEALIKQSLAAVQSV